MHVKSKSVNAAGLNLAIPFANSFKGLSLGWFVAFEVVLVIFNYIFAYPLSGNPIKFKEQLLESYKKKFDKSEAK